VSKPQLATKQQFIADIGAAVATRTGFAAGKIGFTEQHLLYYVPFLAGTKDRRKVRAYEVVLWRHFEQQAGIFPSTREFAREFVAQYGRDVQTLDCLGVYRTALEPLIIAHYDLRCRFVGHLDMEPDRSPVADDSHCYLPHLRGRRVLLVAPFAELLRERANRHTFEQVWSRIDKRWFEPASVAAVEFPYALETATHARFPTVLDLRDEIAARIDQVDFDVALIAAGGLGIPLAAHVKRAGRIGISLGGHLQVLFGVLGERWRNRNSWRRRYFNDAWIDMPERYRPPGWRQLTDGGAYW
jgi:hypothetical protein